MPDDNRLELMKQKYSPVLAKIEAQKIRLTHLHIQDGKLFIQGFAPTEQAKNTVWDSIKLVNPNWAQELTVDLGVDPSAAPAEEQGATGSGGQSRTYNVQAGDTLSRISKAMYGNADAFMKIFEANRDVLSDPDKIRPGQTLKIPG